MSSSQSLIRDIIPLCDAFDINDHVLASTVGTYNGHIYEDLFNSALLAENNQQSPWDPAGYNQVLANRVNVDFLDEVRDEQRQLYVDVFGKERDVGQVWGGQQQQQVQHNGPIAKL